MCPKGRHFTSLLLRHKLVCGTEPKKWVVTSGRWTLWLVTSFVAVACGWRCVTGVGNRDSSSLCYWDLIILSCSLSFFLFFITCDNFLFGWSSSSLAVLDSNRCIGSSDIMILSPTCPLSCILGIQRLLWYHKEQQQQQRRLQQKKIAHLSFHTRSECSSSQC